jgi:hypothetical protein
MNWEHSTRRSFATALGAAFAFAVGSPVTGAQGRATTFQPARHPQDAWLDSIPGKHRTFIDTATVNGGGSALLYAYRYSGSILVDHGRQMEPEQCSGSNTWCSESRVVTAHHSERVR